MNTVGGLLRRSGLPTLDARALLAHTLGVTRETLVAHPERPVAEEPAQRFNTLSTRRRAGEPLAYLVGEREFLGRTFRVTPDTLIPRPETELLVERALAATKAVTRPRILDLGTGSGCIAISLALERCDATVTAIDRSAAALAVAAENARRLGARVTLAQSDWYTNVRGRFDILVANPPYVAEGDPHLAALSHEPQSALVAPDRGLACLRTIITNARRHLAPKGWLLVEHGYDQAAAVRDLFATSEFTGVVTTRDGADIERVTAGQSLQP